uniref:Uncharacterized protein n=1 Tax=Rousettus aegyptiacus TaxID=9407 RepID=A0A7J8BT56_ROUAE|nr:hypothetical protein HJG63_009659 [Rousettus aegyptiacus]
MHFVCDSDSKSERPGALFGPTGKTRSRVRGKPRQVPQATRPRPQESSGVVPRKPVTPCCPEGVSGSDPRGGPRWHQRSEGSPGPKPRCLPALPWGYAKLPSSTHGGSGGPSVLGVRAGALGRRCLRGRGLGSWPGGP